MAEESLKKTEVAGESYKPDVHQAVPEHRAVGARAPNGRAERIVQRLEDLARTYRLALQARLGCAIPTGHPISR